MPVRIKWRGRRYKQQLRARAETAMKRAGVYLNGETRKAISRSQPYVIKNGRYRGLAPSAPGEPPKRLSGTLFKSINDRVIATAKDVRARIGAFTPYSRALELGAPKRGLAPRPYLSSTLSKFGKSALAIFAKGLRK